MENPPIHSTFSLDSLFSLSPEEQLFCNKLPLVPYSDFTSFNLLDVTEDITDYTACLVPERIWRGLSIADFLNGTIRNQPLNIWHHINHLFLHFKFLIRTEKSFTCLFHFEKCQVFEITLKFYAVYHPNRPPNENIPPF